MNCKKCGNEIKEGNEFCTNCGYSINGIKKNKLKEYKIPIMIICIFVIIIILIFGIKAIFNKIDSRNYINNEVNTDTNIVTGEENQSEEKVYITQDSDVSPTGKEFIGEFSNSLTEIYQDYKSGNASMIKKYYSTSISNMKQFSIENSSNNEKIVETVYYYNTLNNKIIGSRYIINDINIYEKILAYNNSTLEEFLNTSIKGSFNIFLNAHNDNSSQEFKERFEKYNTFIADNFSDVQNKVFYNGNYTFSYRALGDTLCIITNYKNNTNKMEVLLLAYDESKNPEEEIKNWYDKVTTLNEDEEDVEKQEDKEEANDDKFSTNKQENSNNSNSDDKQTSNNQNINNNEEEYEDTTITFSYNELKNKTEEELVKLFKEKGLVPKVNKETREVPYVDERADTTVITNSGYGSYEKGETVEIKATYYKPVAWKTYVSASVSGKSFNVKGKTCYTEQLYVNHDVDVAYCFYENPLGLNSYEINRIGRGVEFYINGKLIEKGSSLFKEYTFDKVETITFKVVAPYVYEFNLEGLDERGEGTMIDKNVTLYEKKINVKDLYSGEGEKAKIEIN